MHRIPGSIPPPRPRRRRLAAFLAGALLASIGVATPAPAATDWSNSKTGLNTRLLDVAFANPSTGVAVGAGGAILFTSDGGSSWVQRSVTTSGPAAPVLPVNAELRTVVAQANCGNGPCFWIGAAGGQILFSKDGQAAQWCGQNTGTTEKINGLFSAGNDQLYAVGTGGLILSTSQATNCATTYARLTTEFPRILTGVAKIPNGPLVVVGASGTILRQVNGTAFELIAPAPTRADLDAVALAAGPGLGGFTLTAVGEGGTILTSPDGLTWKAVASRTPADLHDVAFPVNHQVGFAVGNFGTVLSTGDGGATWTRQTTSTCNNLFGVSMIGNDRGWAAGGSGTILLRPGSNGKATAPNCGLTGAGYRLVASDGGIFSFGDAAFFGSTGDVKLNQPIVGMATTPSGGGYWLVASDGGIFSFGDARFFGSTGDVKLNKPIVGMAVTPTGEGYWLVASDGGIFSFGDAKFIGSTGDVRLASPIVGMAASPDGAGYWLVAADGGLFSFGVNFSDSAAGKSKNSPIVGMAVTPTGKGQWLAAASGAVFAFGDAQRYDDPSATPLAKPIVGIAGTPTGAGYWLVASDGGIFAYGDAGFFGSTGAVTLNKPILGMASA